MKDQATFQKNIKENKLQVTFNGSKKKVEKVQEKKEESVA